MAERPGRATQKTGRRDPLAPVLALGDARAVLRPTLAVAGAVFLHGAGAARGLAALVDLSRFAASVRTHVEATLEQHQDIMLEKPPPPPPEPEPEPEPEEPEPKAPPPPQAPPPAPAEAAQVLAAEPDPNTPVDLTGMTFVTGTGDRYVGGTTSAKGTSKTPVRSPHATNEGVPGGTGTAPVVAVAPNLSRQPMPLSTAWDDCGFPAEADAEQIHQAFVTVVVTVAPDGSAKSVRVDKDPGFGFGQLARRCALRRRYQPALDAKGQPVTAPTRPIKIKFDR